MLNPCANYFGKILRDSIRHIDTMAYILYSPKNIKKSSRHYELFVG